MPGLPGYCSNSIFAESKKPLAEPDFANANVLDVRTYTIDGGKNTSWCDHCKGMDACMASH